MTEILALFSLGLLFDPQVCSVAECFGVCLFWGEMCSLFCSKDELKFRIHLFAAQICPVSDISVHRLMREQKEVTFFFHKQA